MRLILALATKGFVCSLDEEDYDWTGIFGREPGNELDECDGTPGEEYHRESSIPAANFPADREIFEEDDIHLIREYL